MPLLCKSSQLSQHKALISSNGSLRLDDLEDSSPLRRGRPSTHDIYGPAQTVNSATFLYIQATQLASTLENQECFKIFTNEMRRLYVGQSYDLYWTHNALCPSIAEYLRMVDDKTGGLFRMLTRMMVAESPVSKNLSDIDLDLLSCLIGRFFQIRDDQEASQRVGQRGRQLGEGIRWRELPAAVVDGDVEVVKFSHRISLFFFSYSYIG